MLPWFAVTEMFIGAKVDADIGRILAAALRCTDDAPEIALLVQPKITRIVHDATRVTYKDRVKRLALFFLSLFDLLLF